MSFLAFDFYLHCVLILVFVIGCDVINSGRLDALALAFYVAFYHLVRDKHVLVDHCGHQFRPRHVVAVANCREEGLFWWSSCRGVVPQKRLAGAG